MQSIIAELLEAKRTLTADLLRQLRGNEQAFRASAQLEVTDDEYLHATIATLEQQQTLISKYSDDLFILSDKDVAAAITAATAAPEAAEPIVMDAEVKGVVSAAAPAPTKAAGKKKPAAAKVAASSLTEAAMEHLNSRVSKCLALPRAPKVLPEVSSAIESIILNLSKCSVAQRKKLFTHLNRLANIRDEILKACTFKPETVTLEYLQQHFHYLDYSIDEAFYLELIKLAINAKLPSEKAKFNAIIQYLCQNSLTLRTIIKRANVEAIGDDLLSFTWLQSCFANDNVELFRILLENGANLGAEQISREGRVGITVSSFKNLVLDFYRALPVATNPEHRALSDKAIKFLNIMFEPQFACGIAYTKTLSMTYMKLKLAREKPKAQAAGVRGAVVKKGTPVLFSTRGAQEEELEPAGAIGVLEFAILQRLPDTWVQLIAASKDSERTPLKNIVKCCGFYIQEQDFALVANGLPDESDTIIKSDGTELGNHVVHAAVTARFTQPVTGRIAPRLYITPCAVRQDVTLAPNLATTNAILERLLYLLKKSIQNTTCNEIVLTATHLMSLGKLPGDREDLASIGGEQISRQLGVVILLIAYKPPLTHKTEHQILLMQAVLNIAATSVKLGHSEVIMGYSAFAYRLLLEAAAMPDKSLYTRLFTLANSHQSISFDLVYESANKYLKSIAQVDLPRLTP